MYSSYKESFCIIKYGELVMLELKTTLETNRVYISWRSGGKRES